MKIGKVVSRTWATKRLDELPAGALLYVQVIEGDSAGEYLVAYDPLGCNIGEKVLISGGSVARGWFKKDNVVDALIIGSIDETDDT